MKVGIYILSIIALCFVSSFAATVNGLVKVNSPVAFPISDAVVTFVSIGGGGRTAFSDTTDKSGNYLLPAVPAGYYRLQVSKPGYTIDPSGQNMVHINRGDTNLVYDIAVVSVNVQVTVSGIVSDSESKEHLYGAKVILARPVLNGFLLVDSAITRADGRYGFTVLQAGSYTVTVSCRYYHTKTRDIAVTGNPNAIKADFLMAKMASGTLIGNNKGSFVNTTGPFAIVFAKGGPGACKGTALIVRFADPIKDRVLAVFSSNGKNLFRREVPAGTPEIRLPQGTFHSGSAYIVHLRQGASTYCKLVVIP